jgi:carbon starvation protein
MSLLVVVLGSAAVLGLAYLVYGRLLARLFRLDPDRPTPAVTMRDDVDYQPLGSSSLLPQHFSAIAAAGPIAGPIMAGLAFGWVPALIWILAGSIFIGGVHDFASLVASIRHKARSIAEVVREQMSPLAYYLFLIFIWIALVYIIVAFADITAGSFVGPKPAEPGTGSISAVATEPPREGIAADSGAAPREVVGPAIAGSSLMYLLLPLAMGLAIRFGKLPARWVVLGALPLVIAAILLGKYIPIDLQEWTGASWSETRKYWAAILLGYCLIAGVLPVWLLLQPRGELGGYFLYAALGIGALGLVLGGGEVRYPAFRGWAPTDPRTGLAVDLFPMLFIMIACGACSGFHALIASGTTSKQLKNETDARVVGYGTMLLEGMVAVVSLCCVMMFAAGSSELAGDPNMVYAQGIGSFSTVIGIPKAIGISFALLAFTTFVYDTLDVCARLGRFVIEELTGLRNWFGKLVGTALTAGVPLWFLWRHPADKPELYKTFWNLFGASNQLLAALTLIGVTVWLWQTYRRPWVWFVAGLPAAFMYFVSVSALFRMTWTKLTGADRPSFVADPVPYIGVALLALAAAMLFEAVRVLGWKRQLVVARGNR